MGRIQRYGNAWSVITSIASVLVSLTTLAALAVVATFSVFAAGAMQLEVLGLFRRDFAFHHEAGFHLVPAGAVACALHGWLPLYCGLVAAAALGVFFLAIYARSLVGRLCFWLRTGEKNRRRRGAHRRGLRLGVRDLLRGPGAIARVPAVRPPVRLRVLRGEDRKTVPALPRARARPHRRRREA